MPAADQSELCGWFLRRGELVNVSGDALYTSRALEDAEKALRETFPEGDFSLGEARDLLGTARKNAQQICEFFDQAGITCREGGKRFWRNA